MADEFDELFDTATFIRCPGLNMRNSVRQIATTTRCLSGGGRVVIDNFIVRKKSCYSVYVIRNSTIRCKRNILSHNISSYSKSNSKCYYFSDHVILVESNTKCLEKLAVDSEVFNYIKRPLSCKPTSIFLLDPIGSKRCGTIYWTPNNVQLYKLITNTKGCIETSIVTFDGTSSTTCRSKILSDFGLIGLFKPVGCKETTFKESKGEKGFCGPALADPSSFPPMIFGRLMGGRQPRIFGTRDNGRMSGSPRYRK